MSMLPPGLCGVRFDVIDAGSPDFADVLALRRDAYGRAEAEWSDPIDHYSFHVVAWQDRHLIGSMRVTCSNAGPLESETFYPRWLIEEFGHTLCGCSRLCVAPVARYTALPVLLMRRAWVHALPLGIRVDVSKVRRRAIPYYLRIGGYFLRDSCFQFDRWHVECGLVAVPVNPTVQTPFSDLFENVMPPCYLGASLYADRFTRDPRDVRRRSGKGVMSEETQHVSSAASVLGPSCL